MRGTVAKRLRKQVYGDNAIKGRRRYQIIETIKKMFIPDKKNGDGSPASIDVTKRTYVSIGFRKVYQDAKRRYYGKK